MTPILSQSSYQEQLGFSLIALTFHLIVLLPLAHL